MREKEAIQRTQELIRRQHKALATEGKTSFLSLGFRSVTGCGVFISFYSRAFASIRG